VSELGHRTEPDNLRETRALSRVHYLRQAAAWAPVVWFPAVLVLILVGNEALGLAVGIAGAAFSLILRGSLQRAGARGVTRGTQLSRVGFEKYGRTIVVRVAACLATATDTLSHSVRDSAGAQPVFCQNPELSVDVEMDSCA
jgi:hypothetical protein